MVIQRRGQAVSRNVVTTKENIMANYSTILFSVRDKVGHLALNRPESANSLNGTVSAEMMDAVVRCEDDPDIRALVVTGSGRFFCAGADLKGFYSPGSELKSRVSIFHATISRLARGLSGHRGSEWRRCRCRNGTRLRMRFGDRGRVGALHDGLHENRPQPRR